MTAEDFIKAIRRVYRGGPNGTEPEMLAAIPDHFLGKSPTEQWWDALDATHKATWTVRFKTIPSIAKPRAQLLAELSGMQIAIDELAKDHVMVQGEKVTLLMDFAARMRDAVLTVNAGTSDEGRGRVEEHKRQRAIESTMDQLTRRVKNVCIAPASSPEPIDNVTAPATAQNVPQNAARPRPPANGGGEGGGASGRGGNGGDGGARERSRTIPPGNDDQTRGRDSVVSWTRTPCNPSP
ncbi:hypothetical protein DFH08DRAFT_806255 [Mycena albidolilacea]|uniref:Uncharacterized protein n=1 Tax=Mycena albidolilacea TaxID=1033008 RepID=A0AAD7A7W4_9AGAR|nr:hypothetical protein DFH08DRAFT_806255 [Mycena albidolilacea]